MSINAYICGCVRNNAPHLLAVFANIARLTPQVFQEIHIVVAYDVSDDASLELLLKLQTQFPHMDILAGSEPRSPVRVENIARARNTLLAHLRRVHFAKPAEEAAKWPYFAMMDMDDVCTGEVHPEVLAAALKPTVAAAWDALCFNSDNYYDIWALSYGPYIHSCWHWDDPVPLIWETHDALKRELAAAGPDALFPCLSAFGGFAIYRIGIFLGGQYLPRLSPYLGRFPLPQRPGRSFHTEADYIATLDNPTGAILGDCEHRHFHMEAVCEKGARVRISPRRLFDAGPAQT